ncbi:MAG: DUF547 domain-containing protein [Planctomycetota bacterium]
MGRVLVFGLGVLLLATFFLPASMAEDSDVTSGYDAMLREHVDGDGFVDYEQLRLSRTALDAYVDYLATVDLDGMAKDDRLATLINAYNAFMLQMVLDAGNVEHVLDDLEEPFDRKRFTLAGEQVSLNGLENDWIRADFDEPRIHWAVNCAAASCPPLRAEAYVGNRLNKQLAEQERLVHTDEKFVRYDGDTLFLTPLYDWYGQDFVDAAGSVYGYVRPLLDLPEEEPAIEFTEYDWTLNDVRLKGP